MNQPVIFNLWFNFSTKNFVHLTNLLCINCIEKEEIERSWLDERGAL